MVETKLDFAKPFLEQYQASLAVDKDKLSIIWNEFGTDHRKEFPLAMAVVPDGVTEIDLRYNHLDKLPNEELIAAIAVLPGSVKILRLENLSTDHRQPPSKSFHEVLRTLAGVTTLSLGYNKWGGLTGSEFIALCKSVPDSVTALSLDACDLSLLPAADLAESLSKLPGSIKVLNLDNNYLGGRYTTEELELILKSCHAATLKLSANNLGNHKLNFKDLSPKVRCLDLSVNNFYGLPADSVVSILSSIPLSVTELSLDGNNIYRYAREGSNGPDELPSILTAIPVGVTSLDLSNNCLFEMLQDKFPVIMSSLGKNIRHLKLGGGSYGDINVAELKACLSGIPEWITSVDLGMNHLHDKSVDDMISILTSLPPTVRKVRLSANPFVNYSEAELEKLGKALTQVVELKLDLYPRVEALEFNIPEASPDKAKAAEEIINKHVGAWVREAQGSLRPLMSNNTSQIVLEYLGLETQEAVRWLGTGADLPQPPLTLASLADRLNDPIWDRKGYLLPFFDFRKTPTGIVDLRALISQPTADPKQLLADLKAVAQSRLDSPPFFTKRKQSVTNLYESIVAMDDELALVASPGLGV